MVKFNDVKELLETEGFADTEIAEETNLCDDLGLDSTEIVDFCAAVEKKFNTQIDPDLFDTVGELVTEINKNREA